MKELEEHVAKAMHSADYKSGRFEWEEYDAGTRAAYLEGARSVLRAIEDAGYEIVNPEQRKLIAETQAQINASIELANKLAFEISEKIAASLRPESSP